MIASDPIRVVLRVVTALEDLGVSYLVGGSIVSSYFGLYRPTQDVDLVAHLEQHHVDPFVRGSYARISCTTFPCTSVRRKSRPA